MSVAVTEPLDGIVRVTLPLPFGIDHVHCYLLRGPDGWTLVDAGLGTGDAAAHWESVFERLDGPVARIVVTHFHPDHVGAARIAAEIARAPVYEGTLDRAQCLRAWGPDRRVERFLDFTRRQGLPEEDVEALRVDSDGLAALVAPGADPLPLEPGDRVDGWEVVHLPGHADGHLCLLRDGVLVAGDAILAPISPNIGLYADSSTDPVGDYLASLERIVRLRPRVALGGHGDTIANPAARARELIEHHADRLERTLAALGAGGRQSGYDVSLVVFPGERRSQQRRFALAETCAHLEHLVLRGRARRLAGDGVVGYEAA